MMKTSKEYPATHSIDTAWFAIDIDGNLAMMECGEPGPAPCVSNSQTCIQELMSNCFGLFDGIKIDYTDEQINALMSHSISSIEYLERFIDDSHWLNNFYDTIVEIDSKNKEELLKIFCLNPNNKYSVISDKHNIYAIDLSLPYYEPKTDEEINENIQVEKAYSDMLRKNYIKRLVRYDFFDIEEVIDGETVDSNLPNMMAEDIPYFIYRHDFSPEYMFDRLIKPLNPVNVKQIRDLQSLNVVRVPLRFSESKAFHIAQYEPCYFNSPHINVTIDGEEDYTCVNFHDGNTYFVKQAELREPIEINDAFNKHEVQFNKYYAYEEYVINGKRGYFKYQNSYFRIGSLTPVCIEEINTIKKYIENK